LAEEQIVGNMVDKNASRNLIAFIRSYTDLMEQHLGAIKDTMRETVDGVMHGIQQISDATAEKKRQANEVLLSTYMNPTDEAKDTLNSVQDEVNRILESAAGGADVSQMAPASSGQACAGEAEELRDKLRRSGGLFSKHMEALETLDGELQDRLMAMMGVLSRDDIIAQRIQHVVEGLQALQMSLSYMLVDYETRCRSEDVDKFVRDLRRYLLRSYTSEEEKKLHYAVFPEDRKAS
jgi:hypothetical protein